MGVAVVSGVRRTAAVMGQEHHERGCCLRDGVRCRVRALGTSVRSCTVVGFVLVVALFALPGVGCAQSTLPIPEGAQGLGPGDAPYRRVPVSVDETVRSWLGVSLDVTTEKEAKALGYAQPLILVDIVFANSPAVHAGLKTEDLIVRFGGTPVYDIDDLIAMVMAEKPGATVTITRLRDGKEEPVLLVLEPRPDLEALLVEHYVGRVVPSMAVTDLATGASWRPEDARGKVVVLDFWATWCGPCQQALPHMAKMHRDWADDGLVIISISDELEWYLQDYVKEHQWPHIMAYDAGRIAHRALMVNALPTVFVIDREGVVQAVLLGGGHEALLDKLVHEALALPEVPPPAGALQLGPPGLEAETRKNSEDVNKHGDQSP